MKNSSPSSQRSRSRRYHLPELDQLPQDWNQLDNVDWKNQEITIEVGCGTGVWSLDQAQKNPDQFYIGVERTQNRSQLFIQAAREKALPNLLAMRAEAVRLFGFKVPPASVDHLVFFYPNPWPKPKQANKRFFNGPSFEAFHQALKSQGDLYLTANTEVYINEAKENLESVWGYEIEFFRTIDAEIIPRTLFEKKYLERGEVLWELKAVKKGEEG